MWQPEELEERLNWRFGQMSENRDGIVTVEISEDKMSAVAFIVPPDDFGKPVDVIDVKKALKAAGVVHGIVNNERIEAFVEEGKLIHVDFMAAAGTNPGFGQDATVTYTWKDTDEASRTTDDGDRIDLRELNLVKSVKKGEVIAYKVPATRGEEGINVKGEKIPGEWGMEVSVKAGANVTASEDGTRLIADMDGSPKLVNGEVSVDPVYVVNGDVDYSTGNINFSGALDIKGNIADGFVVKAEGNITIGGNVQACEVISNGDIMVKGGIITRNEGAVIAKGSISAKFIENSEVEADGNVIVDRAIISSRVRSNGMIICTSREGKIMGGDIMAYHEIRAKHLGTDKETATYLRAGYKHDVYIKMSEMEKKLDEIVLKLESIRKSLRTSGTVANDKIEDYKKMAAKLEANKSTLQNKIASLKTRIHVNPFATVKGEEFIHPGCFVYIGASKERIRKPMKFATLSADKNTGGIALSSYDEMTGKMRTRSVGTKEKKKSVLVVDDAKFMRNKLKNILENANFNVLGEAEDGKIAVQLYSKLNPDVVTMDITMPNVDGLTALKAIKKMNPKANVIMISALGQKEKVKDAIIAGAKDFIIKPFVPDKVVEIINRVAGK